ncbi:hypothetical protein CLOSTMETH_03468 [[Clostridium] methylpentosum DSM 5476]|uniref:Uncharacterized protein n=1 Tax=[Clostridium] methylpentosum DSM 5476 TaxID=537013 RepID=C0EHX4_9FIRM|nr:hypothetical protein CLOSTMETH_03468 [[Clostridium] methylpentosum DSM 5476]
MFVVHSHPPILFVSSICTARIKNAIYTCKFLRYNSKKYVERSTSDQGQLLCALF